MKKGRRSGAFFYGRWMWQAANAEMRDRVDMRKVIGDEIDQQGESWPPLQVDFSVEQSRDYAK
jgi:hypothetical protein